MVILEEVFVKFRLGMLLTIASIFEVLNIIIPTSSPLRGTFSHILNPTDFTPDKIITAI